MASLRSLAAELNLSITTVSRALDDYDDVALETRARVRAAAQIAGYRPNSAARRLRKGLSETIAVVMPTGAGRFYEPVFTELLTVLGEALAARHFDLVMMAATPGREEIEAYRRIVADGRADGCLIVRTRKDDARVRFLAKAGVPFVCHGRTELDIECAYVDGDGEAGFHVANTRLVALGHRRIAHLAAPGDLMLSELRLLGWRTSMAEAGLADDLVVECRMDEASGETAAARLIGMPDRPTALVCATDRIAIGAIRAAQAAGLVVGRDIAVIGHDNIHASAFTSPALTTMDFDVTAAGRRVAEMLLAQIGGKSAEGLQEIFPLRHIPRASSGEVV